MSLYLLNTLKKLLGNFLLLPHANAKWKGHVFCKNRDENTCRGWASFNRLREVELRALQQWKKLLVKTVKAILKQSVSSLLVSVRLGSLSWVYEIAECIFSQKVAMFNKNIYTYLLRAYKFTRLKWLIPSPPCRKHFSARSSKPLTRALDIKRF